MAYFIFNKDCDNIEGTILNIAEDQNYLNSLNINQDSYKILETSQNDFNEVKLRSKYPSKYVGDVITYTNLNVVFQNEVSLKNYINKYMSDIKGFTGNNPSHPYYNLWSSYYNQLKELNTSTLTYPFNQSLEQYFNSIGQTALNYLQIP